MGLSRFGGLWVHDGAESLVLGTTPILMTLWNHASEPSPGLTCSLADDGIHIKIPGFYLAYCSLSFSATALSVVYAEMRVNGALGATFRGLSVAAGDGSNIMFMGAAKLEKGDVVQIYVYSDVDPTTFTLVEGQFGVLSV